MRLILLFLATLFLSTSVWSQSETACDLLPVKDGKVLYSDVIQMSDVTASQLFTATKLWVSESFKDASEVIQTEAENSMIALKVLLPVAGSNGVDLDLDLNLMFKDGRYKYEVRNVVVLISAIDIKHAIEETPAYKECNMDTLRKFDNTIKGFIQSLKKELEEIDTSW